MFGICGLLTISVRMTDESRIWTNYSKKNGNSGLFHPEVKMSEWIEDRKRFRQDFDMALAHAIMHYKRMPTMEEFITFVAANT